MSQSDTLLSEAIGKIELAQSFEEDPERAKRMAKLIEKAWEIMNDK